MVCAHRKSARWKALLRSAERASDFLPGHPHLYLVSLVRHHQPPPSNIDDSNPQTRQLGHLRTLCFVVPSVKPLPLPQVCFFVFCFFSGRRWSTPGVLLQALLYYIYRYIYIYLFLLLFLIQTRGDTHTHTHLDKLSRSLPF